ncbi:MAG TPA: transcription termination/antitermination NusG family protein [Candidatus Eisenbacteria bacterium]|nr:transcription termination/antitermination NusG family protein [Candidatus Eisenbacteria bacterium]
MVYSKPHKEGLTQFHLSSRGVESFFPRLRLPGPQPQKKRIVALFPNYLFVHIDLATEAHLVIWTPGVKRLVGFGGAPSPLDEQVVRFLQDQAGCDGIIQARSQLRRGQEVEISGGPFSGLVGIIQDPPDARGRVKVLLKLLSRPVSVTLGVEFLRGSRAGIEPARRPDIGFGSPSGC